MDPLTQQLWAAGSSYDSGANALSGAVVQLDGGGRVQNSIQLRLGSAGSPCSVGTVNYCSPGSSATVRALTVDAANRRLWAAGTQYDASGGNPVLFVAAIDLNSSNVISFQIESSTGTEARGAGVSADGSVWIAGVNGGAAFLWNASLSSGLQEWESLSSGGEANAVAEDASGAVWIAGRSGDTGEFALWDDDQNSGTIFEYDWTNALGGIGSVGRALAFGPGGVTTAVGQASTGSRDAALLWSFSGGAFTATASAGTYGENAEGLAFDDGGNAWITGASGVDGAGDRQFALWELPQSASALTLAATYVDSSFGSPRFLNDGAAAVYTQGGIWSIGTVDNSFFASWRYVLNTGNVSGTLNLQYSGGYSGHNVGFFLAATPTFNTNPLKLMTAAPTGGTTSFSFVLTSLPAPATYYVAAAYDVTDTLGGHDGVPSGDPIGLYRDDDNGTVTAVSAVFVPAGGEASGIDFTAALDASAPVLTVAAPVSGSTIPASAFGLSGAASDNTSIVQVGLDVLDATTGLWWSNGSFSASSAPQFALNANYAGPVNSVSWTAAPGDAGALSAALVPGHQYVVSAQAQDLTGNATTVSAPFVVANATASFVNGGGRGLARGPDGSFWTATDDGSVVRVERYGSSGAFLSSTTLPGSSTHDLYKFAFDAAGDVWTTGTAAAGFGLWKLDPAGTTVLASTQAQPAAGGQLFGGKLAIDSSGGVWVPAAEIKSDGSIRFDLFEFTSGAALVSGFPKKYYRGGGLDGGLSTVIDGSGYVWTAGASSNPVSGKIDFALWKHDSAGALQSGYPVFWADIARDVNDLQTPMILSSNRLWIATSKSFASCANPEFALLQYDLNGVQISSSLWHDSQSAGASGQGLAADGFGNIWAVGQSSGAPQMWKYGANGALTSGFPKAFPNGGFDSSSVALDAANTPWVLNSNLPTLFTPGATTAGASGPAACALAGSAQISGTVTNPDGFTAGGTLTLAVSTVPIFTGNQQPSFFVFTTSAGTTAPYSMTLAAPATYYLVAISTALADGPLPPGAGIGDYNGYAPISVTAGASFAGANISVAQDTIPPASGISSIPNGSTITALTSVAGTATDNSLVGGLSLAFHDRTFDLWWDPNSRQWVTSGTPSFQRINPSFTGNSGAESWRESVAQGFNGDNFGGVNAFLAKGHRYQFISQASDVFGNQETPSAGISFYWNGVNGAAPPNPPQNIQGLSVGVSSVSWNWQPSQGASSYNVFLGSGVFLSSTTQTSFIVTGLSTDTASSLCVGAVNQFGASSQNCGPSVYTDAAVPGRPFSTLISSTSLSFAWDARGNPANAPYQLFLSTDGFVTAYTSANTLQPSVTFQDLPPSTTFFARVIAFNGAGFITDYSPSGTAATLAGAPSSPSSVQGEALGVSSIAWAWGAVSGASGYTVTTGSGAPLGTVGSHEFEQTDLSTNSFSALCVSAFNSNGASAPTCSPGLYTLAAVPGVPMLSPQFNGGMNVNWDSMGEPFGTPFQIQTSTDGFVSNIVTVMPFSVNYLSTILNLTSLTPDTTYFVRVAARNGDGLATLYSPVSSARTFLAPPDAPIDFTAIVDQPNDRVDLSWQPHESGTTATSYNVYQGLSADTETFITLIAGITTTTFSERPTRSATFYYQVAAINADGVPGQRSAVALAAIDVAPPQTVHDLRVTALHNSQSTVDLAWTAPSDDFSGVARFYLVASTNAGFAGVVSTYTLSALPPGTTVTYTASVDTTQVTYFGVTVQDAAGNLSDRSNVLLFDPVPPFITFLNLTDGLTLTRPITISIHANDNVSIASISFSVDGVLVDSAPGSAPDFFWDTRLYGDGAHAVALVAYDTSGNNVTRVLNETLNYAPPATPVISFPSEGFTTKVATVNVSGSADAFSGVQVQANGIDLDSAVVLGGNWSILPETLTQEGPITLTAIAFDSRGFSSPSTAIHGTYSAHAPNPPELITGDNSANGQALISWSAPSTGETPAFYRVYRSTDDAVLASASGAPFAQLSGYVVGDNLAALQFVETPAQDDLYFYAVSAVDGVGNESALSELVYVVTDRVPPSVAVIFSTAQPVTVGVYTPLFQLSEPLAQPPIFTLTPFGGQPTALNATAITATLWQATATITAAMGTAPAQFGFQGTDLSGNVGTAISSSTLLVDTVGPVGSAALSRTVPVGAGTLTITLTLDEPGGATPSLTFTPQGGSAAPLTVVSASTDARTWTASVSITTNTGDGQALLGYQAQDALGNVGLLLNGTTAFIVDATPPPAPLVVRANPLPKGFVALSWSAGLGESAAYYNVYRDGVLLSTRVVPASDGTGSYVDLPGDGEHVHSVSAVDAAGNESARIDPASAEDSVAPSSPVNMTAFINSFGQVEVDWQASSTDTVGYRLYRTTYTLDALDDIPSRAAVSPFIDSPPVNATWHYVVTALDSVGNESDGAVEAVVLYSNAAPVITIAGVADGGNYNAPQAPTFSAFDLTLDTSSVHATLDGQPFVSGSTVSAEGDHALVVTASNAGGHQATSTTHFNLDFTPPAVSFSVADHAALASTAPISVSVTPFDLHLAATAYTLVNQTLGTSVPYDSGAPISRNGAYALTAVASDRAGNSSTTTVSFTLEAGPTAPGSLTVQIQGDARLTWTQPEPGIIGYRVYRDGLRASSSLNVGAFFQDSGYAGGGAHVYEVSAIDAAGVEGPRARATVPAASLSAAAATLTRGYFDALHPVVLNAGGSALLVGPAQLTVSDASGHISTATAPSISAAAGQSAQLEGVIATPAGLGAAQLHAVVALPTDAGSSVSLVGDFPVGAADPALPTVEVLPGPLMPGTLSPVQVRLYNRGTAPLDVVTAQIQNSTSAPVNDVQVLLQTPEGTLLSAAGIQQTGGGASGALLPDRQVFFVTIPPGQSLLFDPVQVSVPNTALTSLSVAAFVSTPTYNLAFLRVPGTRGFSSSVAQGTVSQVPYRATIASDRAFYDQGSSVTLTGQALDSISGNPVPNVTVGVHVVNNGFDRPLTAVTDSSGSYRTVFFPSPSEAGVYSVSAGHPAVVSRAVQATFTLVGLAYQYSSYAATLASNSSFKFTVDLTNTGGAALTGLTASSASFTGSGVTLALDPATLPSTLQAGAKTSLGLTVSAVPDASTSTLALIVTEGHGFTRILPITATVVPAQVIPVLSPSDFSIGMVGGDSRVVSIQIQNKGFDTWRGVQLTNPALSWATIQGLTNLGDIPPGGNANLTLKFDPPISLDNGTYQPVPLLQITSLNVPPVSVIGAIAITSARKGDVLVSVINADKPRNSSGQGVPVSGAKVTLTSLDVSGLSFTVAGDSNGLAPFSQVPSGNYAWRAEATGFQTVSGTAIIEPGLTNKIEAILPTATVSYTWTVTPTTIQDKYDITLSLTFKTDVPAPAIVVDPPLAQIDIDIGQSAYGQYTLTNKGLVSIFDYTLTPEADDGLTMELAFNSIPEIKPGQSVVVPYKVTFVHHSPDCKKGGAKGSGKYKCAADALAGSTSDPFRLSVGPQNRCAAPGGGGGAGGVGASGGSAWPMDASAVSAVPAASSGGGCGNDPHQPHQTQNSPCGGASPLDGSHYEPPAAAIGFPGFGPSFGPGYNSLTPGAVNPDNGAPGATNNPPGWAPPTPTVQLGPDGTTMDQTNPDGSKETIAPLADIKQPSNGGTGKAVAVPPQDLRVWGTSSAQVIGNRVPSLTSTDPDGTVTTYDVYGSSTYLPTAVVDRNGNRIIYERDESGRLLRQDDNFGRWIAFSYNAQGMVSGAADSAGRSTSYAYDTQGNKTAETDVNGDTTHYAYDANHRMTQITYPSGSHMTLVYDGQGRVSTEQEDSGNNKRDYAYYASSTTVVDALGHSTLYEWTQVQGVRRFTRITDPAGGSTSMTYDASLNLASQTDALGRVIQFKYDDRSNLTAATNALGQTTQIAYLQVFGINGSAGAAGAAFNQPVSITDRKGNRTSFTYDAKANLISKQDSLGGISNFTYDAQGHITSAHDPIGNTAHFTYNNQGDLISTVDPLSRTMAFSRDAVGRLTRSITAGGGGVDFAYNAGGNLTQIKDALNGITSYGYQVGRPNKLLSSVTDAKTHGTTFGYDVLGRRISVTNALGQVSQIGYDKKGNATSFSSKNGQAITATYDALDRVSRLSMPEGNADMTYDSVGNLLSISHPNGSAMSFVYDNVNRPSRFTETLPNGFIDSPVISYDANGARTALASSYGSLSYSYDALKRLTAINSSEGIINVAYDAAGRPSKMTFPNGTLTTYSYDAAGQILQIAHQKTSNHSAIAFSNYSYDANGNPTSLTNLDGVHSFTYDQLNRLISANHPTGSGLPILAETFSFDAVGNRISDANRTSYSYDSANRIISDSSMTYTSDADGNRTSMTSRATAQTTTYHYTSGHQLVELDGPAGVIATYKFDPAGRRIEKNVTGTVTRFLFDGPNIRAILDGSNTQIARITYAPGATTPLIMKIFSTSRPEFLPGTYFFHTDSLGSVVALTDESGAIVETYEYQAFGRPIIRDAQGSIHDRSTVGNPFMYAGTFYDSESGLNHAWYRDFDPDTGTFLQEDPVASINQYAYAGNNPEAFRDPFGLCNSAPLGTALGQEAAQFYADQWNATGNPAYLAGGLLASLWTPDTYQATTATLGAGLAVGALAADVAVAAESGQAANDANLLFDSWDPGTFPNRMQSIAYHYEKHGVGQGYAAYTQDALDFFEANYNSAQPIYLRNGGLGVKVATDDAYGIYSLAGKIISYGPR